MDKDASFVLRISFLGSKDFTAIACDQAGEVLEFPSQLDAMAFWMDNKNFFEVDDEQCCMFGAIRSDSGFVVSRQFVPLMIRMTA